MAAAGASLCLEGCEGNVAESLVTRDPCFNTTDTAYFKFAGLFYSILLTDFHEMHLKNFNIKKIRYGWMNSNKEMAQTLNG